MWGVLKPVWGSKDRHWGRRQPRVGCQGPSGVTGLPSKGSILIQSTGASGRGGATTLPWGGHGDVQLDTYRQQRKLINILRIMGGRFLTFGEGKFKYGKKSRITLGVGTE